MVQMAAGGQAAPDLLGSGRPIAVITRLLGLTSSRPASQQPAAITAGQRSGPLTTVGAMMDDDIAAYYAAGQEQARLGSGGGRIEYLRIRDLLSRQLPPPPATVLDVGGRSAGQCRGG